MRSHVTELRFAALVSLAVGLAVACGDERAAHDARVSLTATAATCLVHCDCPQGQLCYFGACMTGDNPVYCCSNPGCPPGRRCSGPQGTQSECSENPSYYCTTACDCGPAHCCKDHKCVKDVHDPWKPGGTEVGPSCVQGVDATYCCSDPLCHAGRTAYGSSVASFRCHDPWTGGTESFCGGKICYFSGDCDPGEQCVDTHTVGLPLGASCSPDGGRCISRAIAETVFGYAPNEFHEACATGCLPGQPCEAGWRPGGVYAVERIVGTCGSCDNGICEIDEGETTANCPADCACGDGQCDTSEFGTCADCATCGNALCDPLETPKLCPADCAVTCGDGSCASEEAATCLQDCACPSSVNHSDLPVACGDGICQRFGDIPEDCDNCRPDCEEDTDSDGDGSKDGCDGCPNDPKKTAPGSCGCHVVDTDTDADGLADCVDACPFDPLNDADGDAVCAGADLCLGTKIPEAVPTAELRFNHWALVDADGTFDTKRAGRGSGSGVGFTTVDTAGCSCEQIIAVLGLGIGQREYGCSTSVMQAWIAQVQP